MPVEEQWLMANVRRTEHRSLLRKIVASDELLSAAGFAEVLTDNATFRFGSSVTLQGRGAIERFVAQFFTTIISMRHDIDAVWEQPGELIYEARVTYGTPGGVEVTMPYANVLRLEGPLVRDYRIYIDPTSMAKIG